MYKKFLIGFRIVTVLLVIGGGIYFYQVKNTTDSDNSQHVGGGFDDSWFSFESDKYDYRIMIPNTWGVREDFAEGGLALIKPIVEIENSYPEPYGLTISLRQGANNPRCMQTDWRNIRGEETNYDDKTICPVSERGLIIRLTSPRDDNEVKSILEKISSTFEYIGPHDKVNLQTDKIFQHSNLYVVKHGGDIFLVSIFSFENEYSGTGTYHLDLNRKTITKLDTIYLYRENGKLYGLKNYPLFSSADLTVETTQDYINNLVSEKLDELSKNLGIDKNIIKTVGLGGIPIINAIVKTEYDPETKRMILLPEEEAAYPIYDYDNKIFKIGDIKYPTLDFVNLGIINKLNGNPTSLFGVMFNYNLATEILNLSY